MTDETSDRLCARCGESILRSSRGQPRARFCSSDCRARFHRERTRVARRSQQSSRSVEAAKRTEKRG